MTDEPSNAELQQKIESMLHGMKSLLENQQKSLENQQKLLEMHETLEKTLETIQQEQQSLKNEQQTMKQTFDENHLEIYELLGITATAVQNLNGIQAFWPVENLTSTKFLKEVASLAQKNSLRNNFVGFTTEYSGNSQPHRTAKNWYQIDSRIRKEIERKKQYDLILFCEEVYDRRKP